MSRPKTDQPIPPYTTPSRIREVTGALSRSTALKLEKEDPAFPRRVWISKGLSAWSTRELFEYLESRPKVR